MSNIWLRWHIGTCEDGKFRMISRNGKVTVGNAIALWALLLEDASHPDHRGICTRGEEFYSAILDIEFENIVCMLSSMEALGMISVGHGNITISNWNKRQFESDSKDPTNTERQRRFKEKSKGNDNKTVGNGKVTVEIHQNTDTDTEKEKNKQKRNFEIQFQEIWEIFPSLRKGNRAKAEVAYRQALTRSQHAEVLAGLKSYVDSDEVKQGFAKGMAAWLNDDRWKTDYASVASSAGETPSQLIEADPLLKNYLSYAKSGRPVQGQAEEYLIIKLGPNWRKYVG